MKVAAVVSTKGGPGKTTVGVNPGAFCADAGLRTLLIDLDTQPSLSSFYTLTHEAPGGTYQPFWFQSVQGLTRFTIAVIVMLALPCPVAFT